MATSYDKLADLCVQFQHLNNTHQNDATSGMTRPPLPNIQRDHQECDVKKCECIAG